MNTQLTLDGREVPHPPRDRRAGVSRAVQARIVELYSQRGASLRSVAAEMFVSPSTVAIVLEDLGIPRRHVGGSRPTLTTEQLLEVGELHALGLSQAAIGERLGVTRSTVHYRLKRLGARPRPRAESGRIAWQTRRRNLSASKPLGAGGAR